jgi:hypothetical protein
LQAIAKGGGQKIMFLPLSSEEFDQWASIILSL